MVKATLRATPKMAMITKGRLLGVTSSTLVGIPESLGRWEYRVCRGMKECPAWQM